MSSGVQTNCQSVSEILNRIGDKWSVQVVVALRERPRRFNEIKRSIAGLSQQMLTRTLKSLERDGFVTRTVIPATPPKVDYALTPLGHSLSGAVHQLAEWALAHRDIIRDNGLNYDAGLASR